MDKELPACCQTWGNKCPVPGHRSLYWTPQRQPKKPKKKRKQREPVDFHEFVKKVAQTPITPLVLSLGFIAWWYWPTDEPKSSPNATDTTSHGAPSSPGANPEPGGANTTGSWALMDGVRHRLINGQIKVSDEFSLIFLRTNLDSSSVHCTDIDNKYRVTDIPVLLASEEGKQTANFYFVDQPSISTKDGVAIDSVLLCDKTSNLDVATVSLDHDGHPLYVTPGNVLTISDDKNHPIFTFD